MRVLIEITDDKLKELVNYFDKMFDEGIIKEYYFDAFGYSPSLFDYFDARDTVAAAVSTDIPEDELNKMAEEFLDKCFNNDGLMETIDSCIGTALSDFLEEVKK